MKVYPVHPKSSFYRFVKVGCSECGNLHLYPKYGTLKERFDGRRYKYVCYPVKAEIK